MFCSDETVFISMKEKFISISITDLIRNLLGFKRLNIVMNLQVNFLTSRAVVTFTERIVLCGMSDFI
jgi:hypothetical protein